MNSSKQIVRYALIGIGNTVLHLSIVWVLITQLSSRQMYANAIAYIVASTVSFFLNAKWSFKQKPAPQNFAKFQAVSVLGLAISSGIGYLGDYFSWNFALTVFFVALAVPLASFLLHRSYTFAK